MPNGNDLINAARSQLNVKEEPLNSNSGPMVNTYLDYVGSPSGSPWCMAFVYWCSCQAGIPGLPKTASVAKFYQESITLGFTQVKIRQASRYISQVTPSPQIL
ncbi:hypothetical protein MKX24_22755 [Klebsiella quasipneumoniae]|uniref:hypothetical protein n=1 Tax=Klebsiella quasipneumoniae TaxID=1463165 RepID=UPI001CE0B4F5|nr:hypothetical protein [Klebsiella quasipneumoniae]MCH2031313.1 hypothetical protein [Klebsiella quasipneumoniae]MDE4793782.1 hypothetical protein [Klebsiella quasipneumoniae subsp. similipneumoniae]MDH2674907.1 hypothetical protein [Klebsiella quasipneumoniae]MDH2684972.1 hypothetical protein [Klebsiella quasipneumoniae]MDQ4639339.1 hypothetical protein [Klebsiella quasipneumoniae subsp. similipneumoniae]